MSTDEYVPSDEDAVDNYVSGRGGDDPGLSLAELRAEYGPEFDRFLARVRRDAWEEGAQHGAASPGYYPDENPYGSEETP